MFITSELGIKKKIAFTGEMPQRQKKHWKETFINLDWVIFLPLIRIVQLNCFHTKQNWPSNVTSLPSIVPHHLLIMKIMPLSLYKHVFSPSSIFPHDGLIPHRLGSTVCSILTLLADMQNWVGYWPHPKAVLRLFLAPNLDILCEQI